MGLKARLFEPHVVLDRFHAAYAARHFNRPHHIHLRAYKAAQLNLAFERFDIDLGGFQCGFIEYRSFDLGGDDSIVNVFARPFARWRASATDDSADADYSEKGGDWFKVFHG